MMAMRSPSLRASDRSWVMKTDRLAQLPLQADRPRPACPAGSAGRARRTARRTAGSRDRWPGPGPSPPAAACRRSAGRGSESPRPPRPTSSSISPARSSRLDLSLPCTSRPKATLSSTRRWGSRPKCWKTMLIFVRRSSRSRSWLSRGDVLAVDEDLARRRLDQARQAADERRLARAREAHDDEQLAAGDRERDVAHGRHVADSGQLGPGQVGHRRAHDALWLGPNTFQTLRHSRTGGADEPAVVPSAAAPARVGSSYPAGARSTDPPRARRLSLAPVQAPVPRRRSSVDDRGEDGVQVADDGVVGLRDHRRVAGRC